MNNKNNNFFATTEHKIGKITYFVVSAASENAKDTLDKKIKKLINKNIALNYLK